MISILIPTMNRPEQLVRLMRYYRAVQFNGRLLIGDASDDRRATLLRDEIAKLQLRDWVRHFHWPGLSIVSTLKRLSGIVDTPFAAFCGDDDFLVPSGIRESIRLLEAEPEIVAANGRAYVFEIGNDALYGDLRIRERYPMTQVTLGSAAGRLSSHMERYTVSLFSVHRTEIWRQMWHCVDEAGEFSFMNEVLPCCMSVVAGRVRSTESVYALRQNHAVRVAAPNAAAWIQDPNWKQSFEYFKTVLAREIVARDSSAESEARATLDAAMDAYLRRFRSFLPRPGLRSTVLKPYRAIRRRIDAAMRGRVLLKELRDLAASRQPDVRILLEHLTSGSA